jgi:hypothetical protein
MTMRGLSARYDPREVDAEVPQSGLIPKTAIAALSIRRPERFRVADSVAFHNGFGLEGGRLRLSHVFTCGLFAHLRS